MQWYPLPPEARAADEINNEVRAQRPGAARAVTTYLTHTGLLVGFPDPADAIYGAHVMRHRRIDPVLVT
jgi:hypothetical protein